MFPPLRPRFRCGQGCGRPWAVENEDWAHGIVKTPGDLDAWLTQHGEQLGSPFESLFVKSVLTRVDGLNVAALSTQYPFRDSDGRQRYCDFTVVEGDDVQLAIEIDGYDKTGSGQGMTKREFLDWQRRHASLVALGWDVLRFANADVRDRPERCAEHVTLVLRRERSKQSHRRKLEERLAAVQAEAAEAGQRVAEERARYGAADAGREEAGSLRAEVERISRELELARSASSLSAGEQARLQELEALQQRNAYLESETSTMKTTIWAMTVVICAVLVLAFLTLGGRGADPQRALTPAQQAIPAGVVVHGSDATPPAQRAPDSAPVAAGASCEAPLAWHAAGEHVGQVVSLEGPVVRVTLRTDAQGQPTFIDVGRRFPSRERLALVIWGRDAPQFADVQPQLVEGRVVCVTGRVSDREGVAQVVLNERHQVEVR